jgi:hypothetical protein
MRILLLAIACAALCGCGGADSARNSERGCGLLTSTETCNARAAAREAVDDATCQGYGAKPGTDIYVQCRVALTQARATRAAGDETAAAVDNAARQQFIQSH